MEQNVRGGVLASTIFPELVLEVKALLRGDMVKLAAALKIG